MCACCALHVVHTSVLFIDVFGSVGEQSSNDSYVCVFCYFLVRCSCVICTSISYKSNFDVRLYNNHKHTCCMQEYELSEYWNCLSRFLVVIFHKLRGDYIFEQNGKKQKQQQLSHWRRRRRKPMEESIYFLIELCVE